MKVIVRCRPMNGKEKALSCAKIISVDQSVLQVGIQRPRVLGSELQQGKKEPDKTQADSSDYEPKRFTFDGVYDDDSTQAEVYADTASPLLHSVFEGYNGTIFAYGQTGCGKTFTMEGVRSVPELRGIIPTTFSQVFGLIASGGGGGRQFLVRASYIEIYNEEVRDLTSDNPKLRCEVKEDKDRGVYIKGLQQREVKSEEELEAVMAKGNSNRTVGATLMNADSSRSHSIFCITVECSEPDTVKGGDEVKIRQGKLNLVDLAGSERQSKTQAEGVRLKEATKINLSLSALGNVIEALVANASGKARHIPYRDSKLTRLLSDSLGGNTKTIMIAAVSPADYNFDETLSTLRYANRAKNIKNKPVVNEDPKDALLREYQDEIRQLKLILQEKGLGDLLSGLKLGGAAGGGGPAAVFAPPTPSGRSAARALAAGGTAAAAAKGEVSVAAVAAVLSGGDAAAEKARELEEELERLSDEKAAHERMRAVIDAELSAAAQDSASLSAQQQQLEERIRDEQSPEVADLLKAERRRLETETELQQSSQTATLGRRQEERAEHDSSIKELEAEMGARLQQEAERRQQVEDKLLFVTEQGGREKEALQARLQRLQQKLLQGRDSRQRQQAGQDQELQELRDKERKLRQRQAELAEQQRRAEEESLFAVEKYESEKLSTQELKAKVKQLIHRYKELEREKSTVDDLLDEEKSTHLLDLRNESKHSKLLSQILSRLLTKVDLDTIISHSKYSEGRDEWTLPVISLPVVFPVIQSREEVVVREKSTDGFLSSWREKPSWRQILSQGGDLSTADRNKPTSSDGWRQRQVLSPSAANSQTGSKYYRGNVLSDLSREDLCRIAKERVKAQQLSTEEALRRTRLMSEQINSLTAGIKRRETFTPTKIQEEIKEPNSPMSPKLDVRKRPAFEPARLRTASPSGNASGDTLRAGLPDSAFAVPVRPAFSPKQQPQQPVSPLSPHSPSVDLSRFPKGRPAFTPAKF